VSAPVRIAMWSGPRNISTAMMRAFENRPDTVVVDEPFYAFYLDRTGIDHPMREEVIASQPSDWRVVAESLFAPVDAAVFYQKHMTHHLLPEVDRGVVDGLVNCFLVRDPREMLASYVKKRESVTLTDLGVAVQLELFERARRKSGATPPVLLASDVLRDPRGMLQRFCAAVGIAFDARMLSWPAGRRVSDGVWAPHWYGEVERSTGFAPYAPRRVELPPALEALAAECAPYFDALHAHRLVP
jgi:sulfotransferase family protein